MAGETTSTFTLTSHFAARAQAYANMQQALEPVGEPDAQPSTPPEFGASPSSPDTASDMAGDDAPLPMPPWRNSNVETDNR